MNQYLCPECPTDCTVYDLPPVSFAECVDAVTSEESEITDIFISTSTRPSDWSSESSWTSVLSDSGVGVRRLLVIGDTPEPEITALEMSKRRERITSVKRYVNADVDDVNVTNYNFMRKLQSCGGTVYLWYLTAGGFLYGGQNGIVASVVKAYQYGERGENNYSVLRFQFSWDAKCDPEKVASPFITNLVPLPSSGRFEPQFEPQFE